VSRNLKEKQFKKFKLEMTTKHYIRHSAFQPHFSLRQGLLQIEITQNTMQRLLPYLPDGSAEAAESLITINRDLDALLLLDLQALWAAVRSDTSMVTFLDSYLRNALRPFDDGFQELSDIEHAVWRHAAALFVKL